MGTPKYAQEETDLAPRETPTAPPRRRFNEKMKLSRMKRGSPVWGIDFFETSDRLAEGFKESGREFEMDRRTSEVAARRLPGVKRVGRLEESLYWLSSAAVLGYLLLEIIGR
jgi:hypothetical protein